MTHSLKNQQNCWKRETPSSVIGKKKEMSLCKTHFKTKQKSKYVLVS